MEDFGGPGEIRTHDLFHAMEARVTHLHARFYQTQVVSVSPSGSLVARTHGCGTDVVVAREARLPASCSG